MPSLNDICSVPAFLSDTHVESQANDLGQIVGGEVIAEDCEVNVIEQIAIHGVDRDTTDGIGHSISLDGAPGTGGHINRHRRA